MTKTSVDIDTTQITKHFIKSSTAVVTVLIL
jgi:hypothetical protein